MSGCECKPDRAQPGIMDGQSFPVVVCCECGLTWHVAMVRGAAGQPGWLACTCSAELVAWSGTVSFKLSPIAPV